MTEFSREEHILDTDRFPLPQSLDDDEFLNWARSLGQEDHGS